MEQTPDNSEWKVALDELGISYRQRRISGALAALCLFHDEKTPSMWAYPGGNLHCYGCGHTDVVDGFVERIMADEDLIQAVNDHIDYLRSNAIYPF